MIESIYFAPDIRRNSLEELEESINAKRVKRLILSQKYSTTVLDKANLLKEKELIAFEKQKILLDKALLKVTDDIEKCYERLKKLVDKHDTINSIEQTIEKNS